ncbi:MAG: creatininase family protein [Candidatus Aminicenantes bacterium]|nr:creatininase family protein [Candidatus Aminicenantes bacterium]
MSKILRRQLLGIFLISLALVSGPALLTGGPEGKPLVLQEMSWIDVRDYLNTSDMVIIPLGSTEQHGPQLPLGSDWYETFDISKMISARTGVVVAPVVMAGYSVYHSGFPGTLSLKPETMEQVLYETAEMLVKYGFKRIMFFNSHGGNSGVETAVVRRINQSLEAIAVAIGEGSPVQAGGERLAGVWFDEHAGIEETSMLLRLEPELVHIERAEKPVIQFSPKVQELLGLLERYPQLGPVLGGLLAVPEETKKGGSSRDISSNGIWSLGDPKAATREIGDKIVTRQTENAVKFIQAWKQAVK